VTARLALRLDAIGAARHPDDVGLIHFSGLLRDSVFSWQKRRFSNRKENIERQYRLAAIAAGLNYSSKGQLDDDESLSEKLKQFAFLYAAQHLRELYNFEKIPQPRAEAVRPSVPAAHPPSVAWREVWSAADGFNETRNAFVLIAGSKLRGLDAGLKSALVRLPWSLVIDFDNTADKDSMLILPNAPFH